MLFTETNKAIFLSCFLASADIAFYGKLRNLSVSYKKQVVLSQGTCFSWLEYLRVFLLVSQNSTPT